MIDQTYAGFGGSLLDLELEKDATELLKRRGAFRRGTGIRGPRAEREAKVGHLPFEDHLDNREDEAGVSGAVADFNVLGRAARLTPLERAVFQMNQLLGFTLREIAARLGISKTRAHQCEQSARRKLERYMCAISGEDRPVSAHALFYQEVRQKQACNYHAPVRSRSRSSKPAKEG